MMSVKEVATQLAISRAKAYEKVRCGEIPSVAYDGRILVPRAVFDRYVQDLVDRALNHQDNAAFLRRVESRQVPSVAAKKPRPRRRSGEQA